MAAVRARWSTIDPVRGRQGEPVERSNWSAATSRKSSMLLRRSISVRPSAMSRSSSTERIRPVLFLLAALLGGLVVVEFALHAVGGAVEEIDRRPQQAFEVGLKARGTECR